MLIALRALRSLDETRPRGQIDSERRFLTWLRALGASLSDGTTVRDTEACAGVGGGGVGALEQRST